jgi:4-aminobutyrate aminotransferase-like enzyme
MTSKATLRLLRAYESRNVTFIDPEGGWPIVWQRARGVHVWDADGRKYLDLTAAFGVAAAGHSNARVVRAGQKQMAELLHAMGDVHPHALKAQLARELSRITFERWTSPKFNTQDSKVKAPSITGKTIFCNSGFETVEAALKTALLVTGKSGVVAFTGAYHGLGYGALNATHREFFRSPFKRQLGGFAYFAPFPARPNRREGKAHSDFRPRASRRGLSNGSVRPDEAGWFDKELDELEGALRNLLTSHQIGAILVEPVQTRGGINIPPIEFLPLLRRLCDEYGALLVLDEIYTGFGRSGRWFACEHSRTIPDVICLGKALTGGFPLSACVGRADVMDAAWPESAGEAIHTSTFLGHPVGCAMALAQIREIKAQRLVRRSEELGDVLLAALAILDPPSPISLDARGCGLMAGLELRRPDGSPASSDTLRFLKEMLRRGFILLPEGEHANVIGFTPPLTISGSQLDAAVLALQEIFRTEGRRQT